MMLAAFVLVACDNDNTTVTDAVGPADAITAVVAWQADEQDPVLDANGKAQLPVIFVVADGGATFDIRVQADVAAATVDWATVRFADHVADTFNPDLDGEPVRDDGVMLLVGPMPESARSVEIELVRYSAVDDGEAFTLVITSDGDTTSTDNTARSASVTSVMQP